MVMIADRRDGNSKKGQLIQEEKKSLTPDGDTSSAPTYLRNQLRAVNAERQIIVTSDSPAAIYCRHITAGTG